MLIPLATLPLVASFRAVAPTRRARATFAEVAGAVWVPGAGLALSGVGFGAVVTFIALLFAQRGWSPAWLPFTSLSVAFMVGRIFFGHLPDRIGGAKVVLVCVLIEAGGQAMIWLAPSALLALAGVTLTGLGYSLVYPALGVEAVRRAPVQSHGLAMGSYTAFLDLSLGLASPALGFIAGVAGLNAVFLASTLAALGTVPIAMLLLHTPTLQRREQCPTLS
jgi:MFS family permease